MDDLLKYKIALTLINGIGPVLAKNLIAYLGSVEAIFKEKKSSLTKIPGIGEILSNEIASQNMLKRAEEEVAFIEKNNLQTYFFTDKSYPFRLKECVDSPIMLYYKGNKNLNDAKFIGIVGTRKVTEYGKEMCKLIIEDISKKIPNAVIVSGLAYGVDIQAHKLAIENQLSTIGVLGHGLDRIYPSSHRPTAIKMLENGGLITEFVSKTNPDRQNFVKRNRIIAGMCDALLVIESGIKGGALITAELANDYNRDVFAIPGKIGDEYSSGCNKLIKENKAALIESADDLLRFMNWEFSETTPKNEIQTSLFSDLSEEEAEIINELRKNHNGVNVNELTVKLNKPYSKLSSKLLDMEFKGLVKCLPGGVYRVI
ncbi:DNA protecting protein DprA [uncultured Paludibacter sp.]|uniref:DNA protecting protein DprA n=1 Tax=uncultured Paludibacter sp. TaxID=497635 RepID=A0A653AGM8_9BACT|nr:DNA protecting protein DprA [uncultured Paludibacter sp.]